MRHTSKPRSPHQISRTEPTKVRGILSQIQYYKEESGWGLFELKTSFGLLQVKGCMDEPRVGMICEVWVKDTERGYCFQEGGETPPRNLQEMRSYAESVGFTFHADALVAKYGMDTLEILQSRPETLLGTFGVGETALARLHKYVLSPEELLLVQWRFTANMRKKIANHYRDLPAGSLRKDLDTNPYKLMLVSGLGFKTVDTRLQQASVMTEEDPRRLVAMTWKAIEMWEERHGHTCVTKEQLLHGVGELCRGFVDPESVIERAVREGFIVVRDELYSKLDTYKDEVTLAEIVRTFLAQTPGTLRMPKRVLGGIELTPEQLDAVHMALNSPFSIITGGPGVGKTTSIRSIVAVMKAKKQTVCLCAPTGKAARRMTEATGAPATTIHKLIGEMERDTSKHCDLLILDECSMLSTNLAAWALKATEGQVGRVLLVGDPDQLPAIGAGRVLGDLLAAKTVPVTRLTKVMRQAAENPIVLNAGRIREGLPVESMGTSHGEFRIFERASESQLKVLTNLLSNRVATKLGRDRRPLDPLRDVQVLVMTNATRLVVNRELQGLFNPPEVTKKQVARFDETFRVGDKVMVTKNSPAASNGEIGFLQSFAPNGGWEIMFPDRIEVIPPEHTINMTLGYAVTVHKSQGSEAPMIVTLMDSAARSMLQRNLLYTAVTRAKDYCVILVDSLGTIATCIANNHAEKRQTRLLAWLTAPEQPVALPKGAAGLSFGATEVAEVRSRPDPVELAARHGALPG